MKGRDQTPNRECRIGHFWEGQIFLYLNIMAHVFLNYITYETSGTLPTQQHTFFTHHQEYPRPNIRQPLPPAQRSKQNILRFNFLLFSKLDLALRPSANMNVVKTIINNLFGCCKQSPPIQCHTFFREKGAYAKLLYIFAPIMCKTRQVKTGFKFFLINSKFSTLYFTRQMPKFSILNFI